MSKVKSCVCFLVVFACLLGTQVLMSKKVHADSDEPIVSGSVDGYEGWTFEVWDYDDAQLLLLYKDGELKFAYVMWDNPNPDTGTTQPGDFDSMIDLAKQKGGSGYLNPSFWDTPLGGFLSNAGIGPANYHNPYGDNEGGMSPSSSAFYDPESHVLIVGGRGTLIGSGFDPNGGPIGDQIVNLGRKKGSNNGDGDSDQDPPQGTPFYDDFMAGPPELINPNPARDQLIELMIQDATIFDAWFGDFEVER